MNWDKKMQTKERPLVDKAEEDQISRNILIWLNTFPNKPVDFINFELLKNDDTCMTLSTIPGTYIIGQDIIGGYDAEYTFAVIYRIRPGGTTPDNRLKADELLDSMGAWASAQVPYIGDGASVAKIEQIERAAMTARYENGTEDHQIMMRLTYHVSAQI